MCEREVERECVCEREVDAEVEGEVERGYSELAGYEMRQRGRRRLSSNAPRGFHLALAYLSTLLVSYFIHTFP